MGVLGPYPVDTASTQVVMAYTYPERFLAQGNPATLVEQPYFTVATSGNAGTWTLTATLNNPPATPPADATFTINGTQETATLTNNQATLTVVVHPSVANAPINVTAGAAGCATSHAVNIGGNTAPPVALQTYTPSGGTPMVAPTGVGSKAFLEAWYALNPLSIESLLADIGTAVNLLTDAVFNVLLPFAEQAAYTPVTLTADQQNALNDIKTNVLPNVYTTLANAFPSGGTKQTQYSHYVTDLGLSYKNFQAYENDLNTIPNLA